MSVDKDLVSVQQARDLVEAAHRAQAQVAEFDQAKIDRICEAMARAALTEAARLGAMAVEETGFGVPADKQEKNRFAAEDVWNYFRGLRTKGVVSDSKDVVEIASPRGVVAGIIPSTNPTSTAIFKILISIKSRNAVVLSPHPSAAKCINETARVMREAGVREGLPADAIGCMTSATIEGTETLMKHKQTAVILATGGIGLVRAAYSSGKPAFGVGPGNVPVCVERTADVPKAIQDILTGKCFDNGTICASEQAVVSQTHLKQFHLLIELSDRVVPNAVPGSLFHDRFALVALQSRRQLSLLLYIDESGQQLRPAVNDSHRLQSRSWVRLRRSNRRD